MVRKLQLFFGAMLFVATLHAQDYLTVPTANPALFQENEGLPNQKLEVFEENFIYLYDSR